jgi:low affinity Fe/Cu permease
VTQSSRSSLFDRFAERSAQVAGGAIFFTACVLLVVLWAPSYFIFRDLNTWQLVINTATTIVTFLLVALLQNSQRRTEEAVNQKLDALADGLARLMHHLGADNPKLRKDMHDLRAAVGAEHVENQRPRRQATARQTRVKGVSLAYADRQGRHHQGTAWACA